MDEFKTPQQEQTEELTRMVEPETVKMGIGQRFIALITAPSELVKNVKAHPVIFAPFLLALVIGLIAVYPGVQATHIILQEQAHVFAERNPGEPNPFDLAALANEYGEPLFEQGALTVMLALPLATAAVIMPFFLSIIATLGVFVLVKIMRGEATFAQTFSMYMHFYVIIALGSLVGYVLMVVTGSVVDMTTLAALVTPNARIDEPAYAFFSTFGVFPIWFCVLTFFGVKVLNNFSNTKAGIIAGIVFATMLATNVVSLSLL
ncbi:MAG: YIP1 family protein [Defluviitaleaceae bacterium]|nr:YIP1 family protein [Defluviitaleaceae bacterium]MCL2262201.1 YIP1 family protein [Defluviitaleaceae bacterium]